MGEAGNVVFGLVIVFALGVLVAVAIYNYEHGKRIDRIRAEGAHPTMAALDEMEEANKRIAAAISRVRPYVEAELEANVFEAPTPRRPDVKRAH